MSDMARPNVRASRLNKDSEGITQYEVWSPPSLPALPRSRLYHLEPIGLGTPYVECLTSYVARLAEAHSISIYALCRYEILPLLSSRRFATILTNNILPFPAVAVNGMGTAAEDWVNTLATLTKYEGVKTLTMLTWRNVLSDNNLLRRFLAWCPLCLYEWATSGNVVYLPLLWAIKSVTICAKHQQPLLEVCQNQSCCKRIPVLSQRTRAGFCSYCGAWLGGQSAAATTEPASVGDSAGWQWQVLEMVGALLASAYLMTEPSQKTVMDSVHSLLTQLFHGDASEMAKFLNVSPAVLRYWKVGEHTPKLESALRICEHLGITLLKFYTGDISELTLAKTKEVIRAPNEPRKLTRAVDRSSIEKALNQILAEHETPAPSLAAVARRLGCHPSYLYRVFAAQCYEISSRFAEYRRQAKDQRKKDGLEAITSAVNNLYDQGVNPTLTQVTKVLGTRFKRWRPEFYVAFHAARQSLGLE